MIKKDVLKLNISSLMQHWNKLNYQTPSVFYFADVINDNVLAVRESLIAAGLKNYKLLYSIKANNFAPLIEHVSSLVDGIDVAANNEYNLLVSNQKIKNVSISATGYAYTYKDILKIFSDGNSFDFSTFSQIKSVFESGELIDREIGLRINTDQTRLETADRVSTVSRFGFHVDDIQLISQFQEKYDFTVTTLHVHGGQKDLNSLQTDITYIKQWLSSSVGNGVTTLNFGGSWDYLSDHNQLTAAFKLIKDNFPQHTIILEPGSLLVRTAGILVSTVVDVSATGILIDSSQFNLSSWFKPQIIGTTSQHDNLISSQINGVTCYENDTFGKYEGKQLEQGDTVLFYPVGAYYLTTSRRLHNLSFPEQFLI